MSTPARSGLAQVIPLFGPASRASRTRYVSRVEATRSGDQALWSRLQDAIYAASTGPMDDLLLARVAKSVRTELLRPDGPEPA